MTFLRLENAAALLENKIKNKHSGVTALTLETVCMKVTNVYLSCHFEEHFILILFMLVSTWSSVLLSSFQALYKQDFRAWQTVLRSGFKVKQGETRVKEKGKTIGNKVGMKSLYYISHYYITKVFFFYSNPPFLCKGPALLLTSFHLLKPLW